MSFLNALWTSIWLNLTLRTFMQQIEKPLSESNTWDGAWFNICFGMAVFALLHYRSWVHD